MTQTIEIKYWMHKQYDDLRWKDGTIFPYDDEVRENIVNEILSHDYHVMLKKSPGHGVVIWIDDHSFKQR